MSRKSLAYLLSTLAIGSIAFVGCGGGSTSKDETACQIWQSVGAFQTPGTVAMERLDDIVSTTGGRIEARANELRGLIHEQAPPDQQLAATEALNEVCREFVELPPAPTSSQP